MDRTYLKKLILPLVAEQLLAVSVGMVDTLMVSTVGETAVSGVALVDNINRLMIQILSAFATGGVVVCSQYFGARDTKRAKEAGTQLERLMTLFSILLAALLILFARPILGGLFGSVEQEVMDYAVLYLVVTTLSYPFLAGYNAGAAIFRSVGNSRISMDISLVMNVINVAGNAVLVFGFHLGVLGVATATLLSRVVAYGLMMRSAHSEKNPLQETAAERAAHAFLNWTLIRKILGIGVPSGIENGMFQIGKLAVVGMVATLGTNAIAANAIGYQIIDFPNIAGVSIGLALVTVVGNCIGAGDRDAAVSYTKKIMKLAYVCDWASKLLLLAVAPFLVSLFRLSPEASAIAVQVLRMFSIAALPVWPLSFVLPNALRGAGDVRYTMSVSIISMWLCRIFVSWFLIFHTELGVLGVWIGMFSDWYVRGLFYTVRFLRGKWLEKRAI